jgi:hypothetical protein
MMDLIERLEKAYGADFMPRFLRITRALRGNANPSLSEVLYYFSLAAGEDLSPRYERLHIAYNAPVAGVTREELAARLKAYAAP